MQRKPATILCLIFFFFNDTATTEIYTLSLHDALPIFIHIEFAVGDALAIADVGVIGRLLVTDTLRAGEPGPDGVRGHDAAMVLDRKSTRLNSSHSQISYAVFCLKKKMQILVVNPLS